MPEQWGAARSARRLLRREGRPRGAGPPGSLSAPAASHPASIRAAPRPCGWTRTGRASVGELHPAGSSRYELASAPGGLRARLAAGAMAACRLRLSPGLAQPVVRRDLALGGRNGSPPAQPLLEAVREAVPALRPGGRSVRPVPRQGRRAGQKSLALRIVMQDTDRTLTDAEVEAVMERSVCERSTRKFSRAAHVKDKMTLTKAELADLIVREGRAEQARGQGHGRVVLRGDPRSPSRGARW